MSISACLNKCVYLGVFAYILGMFIMGYVYLKAYSHRRKHKMLNQCWFNVAHCLRRCTNVKPTLVQHQVFAAMCIFD